jgi:hypothetical protein
LEYGRILWKNPQFQCYLKAHWRDVRHPYAPRYAKNQALVQRLLESDPEKDVELDSNLQAQGLSLRTAMREIPLIFGQFWRK